MSRNERDYYGGTYYDGAWYCACDQKVQKQISRTTRNPGRGFSTCPRGRNVGCKFFYWDDDLPVATARYLRENPAAQQPATPSSSQPHWTSAEYGRRATEDRYSARESSSSGTSSRRQSDTRSSRAYTDARSTGRRSIGAEEPTDSGEDEDWPESSSKKGSPLAVKVLQLLNGNGVKVEPLVRTAVQRVIDVEVKKFKFEVDEANALLAELKLGTL